MLHDEQTTRLACPCGSSRNYRDCCEPAIEGVQPARTAEQLMRSRYSAFALGMCDYLIETTHPDKRAGLSIAELQAHNQVTTWQGLTILETTAGGEGDSDGRVSFVARFSSENRTGELKENSRFLRLEGRWYYVDGDIEVIEN